MTDTVETTESTEEAVVESTEAQAAEEQAEPTADEETTEDTESSDEQGAEERSSEEYQREIKDLRAEAAKYRTQLREAQDALSKAKTPEDVEAAVAELSKQNAALEHELTKSKIARELNIPDALVGRLQGSTEEELREDASALLAVLGSVKPKAPKSTNPSGGLDPEEDGDDSFDYKAWARQRRQNSF